MTFTYASTGDFTTSLAQVRITIGDTDSTDAQFQDEEINSAVTAEGSVLAAAARCSEWLAAKYARKATSDVGDLKIAYSDLFKHYSDLAISLRSRGMTYAAPYAGGISIDRQTTVEDNTDRVQPSFKVGMLDNDQSVTAADTREQP